MSEAKPRLLPVVAPWMVAASAPFLTSERSETGQPLSVTFVGYFKLDHLQLPDGSPKFEIVQEPPLFEPATADERHPYRLVRIIFSGGCDMRTVPAFSDGEVIEEDAYDWSCVPGDLRPGEDAMANRERRNRYWLETGTSPDPGVYEIDGSPWLAELGERGRGLHHYMILGNDDYVEVLAEGWSWQAGQAVS